MKRQLAYSNSPNGSEGFVSLGTVAVTFAAVGALGASSTQFGEILIAALGQVRQGIDLSGAGRPGIDLPGVKGSPTSRSGRYRFSQAVPI